MAENPLYPPVHTVPRAKGTSPRAIANKKPTKKPKVEPAPVPIAPESNEFLAAMQRVLEEARSVGSDPERFLVYENDPLGFVDDVLGIPIWSPDFPDIPGLTPQQTSLLLSTIDNRRIACRSGHGVGKTFVLAILVIWWTLCRRGLVVTTASTWEQIERVLWREINSLLQKSRVPLPGDRLQTEWKLGNDWYAVGLSTNNPTAFQGRHHARLLVVVDEAPGVTEEIHEAIASLAVAERNTVVMVGNPTAASGTFYDAFRKPGWVRLHFSCFDHPNVQLNKEVIPGAVTRIWITEQQIKYSLTSPMYASRVLGEFPTSANDAVVALHWVERSMDGKRYTDAVVALAPTEPTILACDVARYGDNRCVMATRRGDVILAIEDWSQADTMETTGRIARAMEATDAQLVVVDEVGLGAGVLDRLVELGLAAVGFNSGRSAGIKTQYVNRRSEMWWAIRERLETGRLHLPEHEQLRADLLGPTYKINSSGKIQVERKEEMRARGISSPDYADAVIMAFAMDGQDLPEDDVIRLDQDLSIILHSPEDLERLSGAGTGQLSQGF